MAFELSLPHSRFSASDWCGFLLPVKIRPLKGTWTWYKLPDSRRSVRFGGSSFHGTYTLNQSKSSIFEATFFGTPYPNFMGHSTRIVLAPLNSPSDLQSYPSGAQHFVATEVKWLGAMVFTCFTISLACWKGYTKPTLYIGFNFIDLGIFGYTGMRHT